MTAFGFRAVRAGEVSMTARQAHEAFGGDPDGLAVREERFRRHLEAGELWGVEDTGGALVGSCRLLAVDHFFGGRPVRCMDVAGVAVPDEHRRRGVATRLMEGAVAWGAHRGMGLSLLYGYVPPLYRPLGWEPAGTYPSHVFDGSLRIPPAEAMRPGNDRDWPAVAACHERFAAMQNGPARRGDLQWERLRQGPRPLVLDGRGGVDAYVLATGSTDPGDDGDEPPTMDWAATTGRGLRAVMAVLTERAAQGPVAVRTRPDQWASYSDRWEIPETSGLYWMARPLLLPTAVAARGFSGGVTATVDFVLEDPLVAESRGPWRLEVAGGEGRLTPTDRADVVLHIRAAGPLFTGFRSPRQLMMAGFLDGPAAALDALTAAFAGEPPVLLDFF
jgi:predicted N-acetyltransferase YhbS